MSNAPEQVFLPNSGGNQRPAMFQRPASGASNAPVANLENVEDFSKVCRVCATITELVTPIFSGEGVRIGLADKIHRHLPIQVREGDSLPLVMCYQCASTLLATHELVQCSLQAEAALRTAQERRLQQQAANQREAESAEGNDGDRLRRCAYCPLVMPTSRYTPHLLGAHASLLFHCDECDQYVARRNLFAHMTVHAAAYDARSRAEAAAAADVILVRDSPVPLPDSTTTGTGEEDDSDRGEADALPSVVLDAIEDEPRPEPTPPPAPPAAPVPLPAAPALATPPASPAPAAPPASPAPPAPAAPPASPAPPAPPSKPATERRVRQCPHCPKTYTASSSYFYHLKYFHGKSREHECETCGRRFGTRGALRSHAALHEPARGLACDACGKCFRSKSGRYIHQQTHTASDKFRCEQCGRTFRWRAALSRHAARHAARRAHACPTCPRAFSVRADLLRHQRTHRRAKHPCPTGCGATFAQPRYLTAHLKRKHPTKTKRGLASA